MISRPAILAMNARPSDTSAEANIDSCVLEADKWEPDGGDRVRGENVTVRMVWPAKEIGVRFGYARNVRPRFGWNGGPVLDAQWATLGYELPPEGVA